MSEILDQLAEGVSALLAQAPRTSARLSKIETQVSHLADGLSEVLAATQQLAQRIDAAEEGK